MRLGERQDRERRRSAPASPSWHRWRLARARLMASRIAEVDGELVGQRRDFLVVSFEQFGATFPSSRRGIDLPALERLDQAFRARCLAVESFKSRDELNARGEVFGLAGGDESTHRRAGGCVGDEGVARGVVAEPSRVPCRSTCVSAFRRRSRGVEGLVDLRVFFALHQRAWMNVASCLYLSESNRGRGQFSPDDGESLRFDNVAAYVHDHRGIQSNFVFDNKRLRNIDFSQMRLPWPLSQISSVRSSMLVGIDAICIA